MSSSRHDIYLTRAEGARALGVAPETFDRYGIKPTTDEKGKKKYLVKDIIDNRVDAAQTKTRTVSGEELDIKLEQARLTKERADAQELDNAKRRGELAPVEVISEVLVSLSAQIVPKLETLPGVLKRRHPELTAETVNEIKRTIAQLQNAIASEIDIDDIMKGIKN